MWMVYARKEKLLRPTSSDSYENTYRFYFSSEKWFTQKPVDEITTNDGFTFLNSIINKTVTKDKFSTINQVLYGTIWHIINDCEEYANLNIKLRKDLVKLKLKKVYKKIRKRARPDEEAITDEQLKIFLEEIDHQIKKGSGNKKARYYMVKLNFYLGLRIGELAALEVGDIDLDNKMIYIRKGEIRYKEVDENFEYTGHYVREVSEPKTNNAVRSLPIIDEAYQIILELYAYRKAHKYTNKKLMYDDNTSDHYIAHLHAAYTTLKKRTGLGLWCHLQRKTYATRLFNGHADSADIQKLMGHSSIRTTMDNYIISEGDRDARVQTTVQSVFKSASSENEDNLGTTV
jgi:integrase